MIASTMSKAHRELVERGFTGIATASVRCWCGRPQGLVTKVCRLGHDWPRPENDHVPWAQPEWAHRFSTRPKN